MFLLRRFLMKIFILMWFLSQRFLLSKILFFEEIYFDEDSFNVVSFKEMSLEQISFEEIPFWWRVTLLKDWSAKTRWILVTRLGCKAMQGMHTPSSIEHHEYGPYVQGCENQRCLCHFGKQHGAFWWCKHYAMGCNQFWRYILIFWAHLYFLFTTLFSIAYLFSFHCTIVQLYGASKERNKMP